MTRNFEQQLSKIKVLFIAANPANTDRLQLDEEIRLITEKIRASEHRDLLEIISIWAVRTDDLIQYLNIHKPQIVHFSGHGNDKGEIMIADQRGLSKPISTDDLRALFTIMKDNVRVVILNACYSQPQAQAITEIIDCALGMNKAIGDQAARTFAASFYRAIGFGRSVQDAFEQGKLALLLEKSSGKDTPELLVKTGIEASRIFLVTPLEDIILKQSKSCLNRGRNALLRNDYGSARRDIEKAIELFNEEEFPEEAAKAQYFLALTQLNGGRPFIQTQATMKYVESLIQSAIALHRSYSYLLTLAIVKCDFARNGLPHLVLEAQSLINEANRVAKTTEDIENLELLITCQPHLAHDYLS